MDLGELYQYIGKYNDITNHALACEYDCGYSDGDSSCSCGRLFCGVCPCPPGPPIQEKGDCVFNLGYDHSGNCDNISGLYLFRELDLINSFIPLIVPYSANATGVYLIYNFLVDFPVSLEEAARIDGAGEFRIFWKIVCPCIKPVMLTLAFITFLAIYNDFLWPSLVVSQNEMKTLTTGIASLVLGSNFVNPGLMMAATLIAVLPALILFMFLNKYLVRSDTNVGIK